MNKIIVDKKKNIFLLLIWIFILSSLFYIGYSLQKIENKSYLEEKREKRYYFIIPYIIGSLLLIPFLFVSIFITIPLIKGNQIKCLTIKTCLNGGIEDTKNIRLVDIYSFFNIKSLTELLDKNNYTNFFIFKKGDHKTRYEKERIRYILVFIILASLLTGDILVSKDKDT